MRVDSPFMSRAIVFLTRCQVHGRGRAMPASGSHDPGGFVISPENTSIDRPCGSLTCSGITGLVLCGVDPEDRRIRLATTWLRQNFTLDKNPGMSNPDARLFDYYWSFATAMNLLNQDTIVDDHDGEHAWRTELIDVLRQRQAVDGSWANLAESAQMSESLPCVTTSLALLALAEALSDHSGSAPRSLP